MLKNKKKGQKEKKELFLTHFDGDSKVGQTPLMVDISKKKDQLRVAKAVGQIRLSEQTIAYIKKNKIQKGKVLEIAEIAGIMAAKKSSDFIPLCHPLYLTKVKVIATVIEERNFSGVLIKSEITTIGKTGVEIEALMSVQVALLTVYDMCKAIDKKMKIENIYLLEKTKDDL